MISARGAASAARGFARNPVRYAKQNPVPAVAFLFLALVAIALVRRGRLPDEKGAIAIVAAAVFVVLAASIAPDLVTWTLLAALVVSVAANERIITDLIAQGSRRFQSALSEVA